MKRVNTGFEEEEGEREDRRVGRRRRALPVLVAVLMVALLVTAGCSESGAATQDPIPGSGGGDVMVEMVGSKFEPETVTVEAGGSITWVNLDSVSHNAVADDGSWKTEIFSEGGSVTLTFDTPGTYSYVCTLHPRMVGTVIVQ